MSEAKPGTPNRTIRDSQLDPEQSLNRRRAVVAGERARTSRVVTDYFPRVLPAGDPASPGGVLVTPEELEVSADGVLSPNADLSTVRDNPGEHLPLGFGFYRDRNNFDVASEVQYARVWLTQGRNIDRMRTFVDAGGAVGRDVRMGIYGQTNPLNAAGVPRNRVAQTGPMTTGGADGTFLTGVLTAVYTVPLTGYYWVAIITNSVVVDWATTKDFPADFAPVRREAGVGVTLPPTAGALTNPRSAVAYCAAVEQ